jgi:hypothetical protein
MKKFFYLFAAITIIASCSSDNDSEKFYESFGVVKENGDASGKFHVRSDNGKVIVPTTSNILSLDDRDRRVWLLFSTNGNIDLDTIKASVYDFIRVPEMSFTYEFDELKSDIVTLNNMWIAQNYLTLRMKVRANSENSLKNHKYTMYSDLEFRSDTLQMEFKYDNNDDAYGTEFSEIVALKLDQLPSPIPNSNQNVADSVVLAIKYRSTDSDKVVHLKYKRE